VVEVTPRDIGPKRLSACQRDAAGGLYAQAMAGYIQWLAPRLDQVRAEMSAAHAGSSAWRRFLTSVLKCAV